MYVNDNRDRATALTLITKVGPKKAANESVFGKVRDLSQGQCER